MRRLMQVLGQWQRLDRALEFLPDEMTLSERALRGEALTWQESGVLRAYTKLLLYDELLERRIPRRSLSWPRT